MIIAPNCLFIKEKDLNDSLTNFLKKELPEFLEVFLNHDIQLNFPDAQTMRALNKQHRQKDQTTDVLSWSYIEKQPKLLPQEAMGEILICLEKAQSQAEEMEISLDERVLFLIVHGFLHVLGLDHQTEAQARQMERYEDLIMKSL